MYINKTLTCGLRVICEKIPYVKTVSVGVWVGVGSRTESRLQNGLSHFIEHMLFKGTKNRTARQIAEQTDFIGGYLNAFTSRECTCYYANAVDCYLENITEILSDMYKNSLFAPEDIELERGVILEEISMYEDSPEDLALDKMSETVWKGSLGASVSGTRERVSAFTREDIVAFHKKYYNAGNTVISVAGNIEPEAVFNLMEKYFGDVPAGDSYTDYGVVEFTPGKSCKEKDIEQAHLCIAYGGIPQNDDSVYALSVLNNIFGNGMSSRLFQNIRESAGLAYSVYSAAESLKNAGVFFVYAGLSPQNVDRVREMIYNEVALMRQKGVTDYELERALHQLTGSFTMSMESVSSRMNLMGKSALLYDEVRTPDMILQKVNAVDKNKINEVIDRVFSGETAESLVTNNL